MYQQSDDHGSQSLLAQPKSVVIHASRVFHYPQLNIDECTHILTALLYHLYQGEVFTSDESSQLFFACTKLFQSNDLFMRRLVYLLIRELNPGSDESLIVINCLSKDVNTSSQELCRGNAVRLLFGLIDESMLQNIEKLLTQTLVDKSPIVLTSALLAAQHVFRYSPDAIRKWKLEIQSSLSHTNPVIKYHASSLCFKMVQGDYHNTTRLVSQLQKTITASTSGPNAKPLSAILLLRSVSKLMSEHYRQQSQKAQQQQQQAYGTTDGGSMGAAAMVYYPIEWLEFLRDTVDPGSGTTIHAVQVESARIIIKHFLFTTNPEYQGLLELAISALVSMLSSSQGNHPVIRKYAALRLLSDIGQSHPHLLQRHHAVFETLLKSSNKSITMLTITILLKFDTEHIDTFLSSMEQILGDSNDDAKIAMVTNLRDYTLNHPSKFKPVISFLLLLLKDENRFAVKNTVVTTMHDILTYVPASLSFTLDSIAEYVEDSEFSIVTIRFINIISKFAHLVDNPSRFIRFLYNRSILESASVRAAALSAIARIAITIPRLRKSVLVLISRLVVDFEDEVRDRARFFVEMLKSSIILQHQQQQHKAKSITSSVPTHAVYNPIHLLLDGDHPHVRLMQTNAAYKKLQSTKVQPSAPQLLESLSPHQRTLPMFTLQEQYKTLPSYVPSAINITDTTLVIPSVDDLEHSLVHYLQDHHHIGATDPYYKPFPQYMQLVGSSPMAGGHHPYGAITPPEQSASGYTSHPSQQHLSQTTHGGANPAAVDSLASTTFSVDHHVQEAPITVSYVSTMTELSEKFGLGGAGGSSLGGISGMSPKEAPLAEGHPGSSTLGTSSRSSGGAITHTPSQQLTPQTVSTHILSLFPEQLRHQIEQYQQHLQLPDGHPTLCNSDTILPLGSNIHKLTSSSVEFPTTIQYYPFTSNILVCHFTIENNFSESILRNVEVSAANLAVFTQPQPETNLPLLTLLYCNAIEELQYTHRGSIFMAFYVNPVMSSSSSSLSPLIYRHLLSILSTPLSGSLSYILDYDGDTEQSTYQLNPIVFPLTAFIRPPSLSLINTTNEYQFDYMALWNEFTSANEAQFITQLALPANLQPSGTLTPFLTYVQSILQQLQRTLHLVPSDPSFALTSFNPQTSQILINLVAISFDDQHPYQSQPQKYSYILARCGCLFKPDTNSIMIKLLLRTANGPYSRYITSLIKL